MSPAVNLHLFGRLRVEVEDWTVDRFPTRRCALLLARVATLRNRRISRDELAETLWPDDFPDVTRTRLRQELRRLRDALGRAESVLQSDRQWVWLDGEAITLDLDRFDSEIRRSERAETPDQRREALTLATSLARDAFLSGYLEPWVVPLRHEYAERTRQAWLGLAQVAEDAGDLDSAVLAATEAARQDPLDERAQSAHIRLLVATGQTTRAHQVLAAYEDLLRRELGRTPSPALRDHLAVPTVPAPIPRSSPSFPISLPRPADLWGREEEMDRTLEALERPGAVVAVVAPIGGGKSHFIHEAAWRFAERTGRLVLTETEAMLGRDGLLARPNETGPDEAEAFLRLARQQGHRPLFATRRVPDRDHVVEIRLHPLPVPNSSESPRDNPAVRLLLSGVDPGVVERFDAAEWSAVLYLVRRMEGLPLALRHLSRRLAYETPTELLQAWDRGLTEWVCARHEGDATMGASWLSLRRELPPEFVAGVERIACLPDGITSESLGETDELERMVRHSIGQILVATDGTRKLRIPEPLRRVIVSTTSDPEVREDEAVRMVAHWAHETSRRLTGPDQTAASDALSAMAKNLVWALETSVRLQLPSAITLAAATWRWTCARGRPRESVPLLMGAAALATGSTRREAEAWMGLALVASLADRHDIADGAFAEARRRYEEADDARGAAWCEMNWAIRTLAVIDLDRAEAMARKNVADQDLMEDPVGRCLGRAGHATILAELDRHDEALAVAREAFAQRLKLSDPVESARAHGDLARVMIRAGRPAAARPLLRESLGRLQALGLQDLLFETYLALAEVAAEAPERAEALGEARRIAEMIGGSWPRLQVLRLEGDAMDGAGKIERARSIAALVEADPRPNILAEALDILVRWLGDNDSPTSQAASSAVRHWRGVSPVEGEPDAVWVDLLTQEPPEVSAAFFRAFVEERFVTVMLRSRRTVEA